MSKSLHVKWAMREGKSMEINRARNSCASLLKTLADDTRLAVVRQLLDGAKHVGEINEPLQLEQSRLSHHLKVLRDAGLVTAERDGKAVLYSLSPEFRAATRHEAIDFGCCTISFEE